MLLDGATAQVDEVKEVASTPAAGLPRRRVLEWAGLAAVTLVAALLRLWWLDQNGYSNVYYAAAVRSMLDDWNNFFFGSFDPAGFISVDKPPVAVWIQALSARILGFSGLSLLLPQALMGTASVVVTYWIVHRVFGTVAGLLAGLILAVTPISVAVDRDNLPDTALVLVLLLATWAWLWAAETGRVRPLLLAAALVGVGFNIKMLAAFVVLPTFYLVYLLTAPVRWWTRLLHLTAATVVLTLVSLSWSTAVELTPPEQRPYVGGSKTNSAFELALGYNGLGRVFGGSGNFRPGAGKGPKGMPAGGGPPKAMPRDGWPPWQKNDKGPPRRPDVDQAKGDADDAPNPPPMPKGAPKDGRPNWKKEDKGPPRRPEVDQAKGDEPDAPNPPPRWPGPDGSWWPPNDPYGSPADGPPGPGGAGPPGGPGRPGGFGGTPGLLRMAGPQLAGQITWFFPMALIGTGAAAATGRWRPRLDPALITVFLWAGWLLTHWVVFSWAQGIFHEYYTTIMGPAVAALAGAGVVLLWRQWLDGGWRSFLLPVALLLTASWQTFVVSRHPTVRNWILPALLGGVGVASAGLIVVGLLARGQVMRWGRVASGIGLAALLIGPGVWSLALLARPGNAVMPVADPSALTRRSDEKMPFGPPSEMETQDTAQLVEFLRANRQGERFLVAAAASRTVAPIIIETGEPAIALGGFMGADPVVTKDEFASLVETGQLRFVLDGPGGRGGPPGPGPGPGGPPGDGPPGSGTAEVMDWVRKHGKEVDVKLWRSEDPVEATRPPAGDGRGRPPGPGRRMERLIDCKPELGLVRP
jgi:4-amino-4-deoxy-L-arabinose transferase-like glycosyltransferase